MLIQYFAEVNGSDIIYHVRYDKIKLSFSTNTENPIRMIGYLLHNRFQQNASNITLLNEPNEVADKYRKLNPDEEKALFEALKGK